MEKNYKKINTRPVEPSIGKTHNQHENAVALLDVDSTLMFGAFGRMSGVNKTPRINQSLLEELKKNDINKLYLFTDMIFKPHILRDRVWLFQKLREQKFDVKTLVCPADIAWPLEDTELKEIDSKLAAQEIHRRSNKLSKEEDHPTLKQLFQPYQKRLHTAHDAYQVGSAYREAENVFLKSINIANLEDPSFDENYKETAPVSSIKQRSHICKIIADNYACAQFVGCSAKGVMYRILAKQLQKEGVTSVIFADDKLHELQSVQHMHSKEFSESGIELTTVFISGEYEKNKPSTHLALNNPNGPWRAFTHDNRENPHEGAWIFCFDAETNNARRGIDKLWRLYLDDLSQHHASHSLRDSQNKNSGKYQNMAIYNRDYHNIADRDRLLKFLLDAGPYKDLHDFYYVTRAQYQQRPAKQDDPQTYYKNCYYIGNQQKEVLQSINSESITRRRALIASSVCTVVGGTSTGLMLGFIKLASLSLASRATAAIGGETTVDIVWPLALAILGIGVLGLAAGTGTHLYRSGFFAQTTACCQNDDTSSEDPTEYLRLNDSGYMADNSPV